jgi:hypothetical protein
MTRGIAAQLMKIEREKEAARKAAIEAALAKPPPPRVSKENWTDWHRRGWFVCPGKRQRGCSDSECAIGARCKRMAELGLFGDGSPLPRRDRPFCDARTRKGARCLARVVPGKRRCCVQMGAQEDLARFKARRRWAAWRARKQWVAEILNSQDITAPSS